MTHTGFPLQNSTVCVLCLIRIHDDYRAWDVFLLQTKNNSLQERLAVLGFFSPQHLDRGSVLDFWGWGGGIQYFFTQCSVSDLLWKLIHRASSVELVDEIKQAELTCLQ